MYDLGIDFDNMTFAEAIVIENALEKALNAIAAYERSVSEEMSTISNMLNAVRVRKHDALDQEKM